MGGMGPMGRMRAAAFYRARPLRLPEDIEPSWGKDGRMEVGDGSAWYD